MQAEELGSLTLFAGLTRDQLEHLARLFEVIDYPAGAQILAAGDRASQLYIAQTGEVVIRYRPYDGGSIDIATIPAGGAFGWSAALKRAYYTSSAVCRTDVRALTIRAHDLHQIMADDPEVGGVLLERTALIAGSRLDSLGQQVVRLLQPKTPPRRRPRSASAPPMR
jgi:CRP/FNR family cyclic AMP-dependent transcriptional regulator